MFGYSINPIHTVHIINLQLITYTIYIITEIIRCKSAVTDSAAPTGLYNMHAFDHAVARKNAQIIQL